MPALYRYQESFREENQDSLIIADQHDIPHDEAFSCTMHCPVAHPGLCAGEHSASMPVIHQIAKTLRQLLRGKVSGSPHCM
eukprot:4223839-Karenia_brevis.AAC.1